MAGAGAFQDSNRRKIKGKKLTVLRFFTVSVAYTIGWYTISSELDYFKRLFGPQILLQLNIAYYLPSIPMLLISGQYDNKLEQQFGTVPVVLVRLVVGLLGCALTTALFPLVFHLHHEAQAHMVLLGVAVWLGMCTGTAFSASYQLVSRFANKNVIALGLGFVGSGIMTLIVQVALALIPMKQWLRQLLLYQIITALTLMGLAGALFIIFRKWREIEDIAASERAQHKLATAHSVSRSHLALQQHENQEQQPTQAMQDGGAPVLSACLVSHGSAENVMTLPEGRRMSVPWDDALHRGGSVQALNATYITRLPSLAAFDFTDPYKSLPLWDGEDGLEAMCPGSLPDLGFSAASPDHSHSVSRQVSMGEGLHTPLLQGQLAREIGDNSMPTGNVNAPGPGSSTAQHQQMDNHDNKPTLQGDADADWQSKAAAPQPVLLLDTLAAIWPISTAMFLSGVTILVVFPFFTYVESSGWCGELLPKVLFFVRLFGDIVGRLLPRVAALSVASPSVIFSLAVLQFASIPAYFWYLKSPAEAHCDVLIIGYVVFVWLLCGYVNTLCNITAPKLVKPAAKSGAAGLMAITFQLSHFTGLLVAVMISYALFGGLA